MSETLRLVAGLIQRQEVRISAHGYDELAADGSLAREVIDGVQAATLVEDYPTYPKGSGRPIHAVWGIPKGETSPAVLITADRPDLARWTDDFLRRRA